MTLVENVAGVPALARVGLWLLRAAVAPARCHAAASAAPPAGPARAPACVSAEGQCSLGALRREHYRSFSSKHNL